MCRSMSDGCKTRFDIDDRGDASFSAMLRVLALLLLVRIAEQCSASKSNSQCNARPESRHSDSSLCRSCKDFLTEVKRAVPRKIDSALDGTRTAARDYLPFYNYVDSTIIELLSTCVQSCSRWLFKCIDPRRECTSLMLC